MDCFIVSLSGTEVGLPIRNCLNVVIAAFSHGPVSRMSNVDAHFRTRDTLRVVPFPI
jgi:hypothetical protein